MTTLRIADDVAWLSREDLDDGGTPMAYVALLPTGRPLALEGPACLVWLAVADGGTLDEVVAATASMADAEHATISEDVRVLVDSLIAAGLVRAD